MDVGVGAYGEEQGFSGGVGAAAEHHDLISSHREGQPADRIRTQLCFEGAGSADNETLHLDPLIGQSG